MKGNLLTHPAEPLINALIVDDEPAVLEGLSRVLRRLPLALSKANSADAALEAMEAKSFDIVCSDERMPGMQGSELLATVRARYPDTVRMLLTGFASMNAMARAINDGAVFRYLFKPIGRNALLTAFEAAIERVKEIRQLRSRSSLPEVTDGLRAAFENAMETLQLHVQPIVMPRLKRVFAYEALVRNTNERLRRPDLLFDAAAALSQTMRLEHTIWGEAAKLAPQLAPGVSLFVNIEPGSLADPHLFDPEAPLTRVAPRIVLELTERTAAGTCEHLDLPVSELRRLGFRLAIDDLGSGYSSLAALAALRPEFVKFDRSLIREIHTSFPRQKLVASLTSLCMDLGITNVAEGIETPQELACVIDVGCDLAQGYLFARPAKPFTSLRWPDPVLLREEPQAA